MYGGLNVSLTGTWKIGVNTEKVGFLDDQSFKSYPYTLKTILCDPLPPMKVKNKIPPSELKEL